MKIEEQIKQWVMGADKYHYLLESEEEYITKEIVKVCVDLTRRAYWLGKSNGWAAAEGDIIPEVGIEDWLDKQL